jgi:hypothetical protein
VNPRNFSLYVLAISSFLLFQGSLNTHSVRAQGPCQPGLNATIDDSERPTRIDSANPEGCSKETVRFILAPPESRTFPFNGQTFSSADGTTITQLFQRNSRLDLSFTYTIGEKDLRINVERLSEMNPSTNRIKLLPVKISIRFNGESASFVFTGQETEEELQAKLYPFFAVGRSARSAGFDKPSERIAAFARRLWNSFAKGDKKKSVLPLKAAFPTTELTFNIFALSFALQNNAFDRSKLCDNPHSLHQSLMTMSGVKEQTAQNNPQMQKVSFPGGSTRFVQDEYAEAGYCCALCEIVHCITDNHWADCLCCLLTCKSCLPFLE